MIGVIGIIADNATVGARIGGTGTSARVYPQQRNQKGGMPAVTVRTVNSDPSDTKSGVSDLDQIEVEVISYASNYNDCRLLAKDIRTALDRTSGTYRGDVIQSIQFLDSFDDYEEIENKPVHFITQNYKVRIKL